MNDIERLVAIEEIKQLKAKYFLGIDYKDWDLWKREVWTPDCRLEVMEMGHAVQGVDEMIEWVAKQSGDQVSIHHGHMPIIEFLTDTSATGLWAMEDRIYRSQEHAKECGASFILGFGHYHETYAKLDVGWRIKSTKLTRLRTEYTMVS